MKVEAAVVSTVYEVDLGYVERKALANAVMKIRDVTGVNVADWVYNPSAISFTLQTEFDNLYTHNEIREIIEGEIEK